jgi:hypothetical protein
MNAYICEWERLDSPTRTMTAEQAKDYYKAHAIAGDCAARQIVKLALRNFNEEQAEGRQE